MKTLNKYGKTTNADSGVLTDIWDRANATDDQDVWTAPTEARVHAIVSGDDTDITGLGTLTLTGLPLDTETVVIGTKTYTFQDTLTDVDGNVKIGASASDSIDNLIAAINLGAGAGTAYAASMTANTGFTAEAGAGDTMRLYDEESSAGATTETLTNGSWGGANTVSGAGARTLRIYGLTSWTGDEVYEDIDLHGTSSVNTTNSFVIIHRMKVLTKGASGPNAGVITATAATDSTVTAQINAGNGQTLMAIYGIPSGKELYLKNYFASIIKAGSATTAEITLLVNPEPDSELTKFLVEHNWGLDTGSNNSLEDPFGGQDYPITGPAIIKLQANTSVANTTVVGGFNGYVV